MYIFLEHLVSIAPVTKKTEIQRDTLDGPGKIMNENFLKLYLNNNQGQKYFLKNFFEVKFLSAHYYKSFYCILDISSFYS